MILRNVPEQNAAVSPDGGVDAYMKSMNGSAGWSDAGVFIPYDSYRQYGDTAQAGADQDTIDCIETERQAFYEKNELE